MLEVEEGSGLAIGVELIVFGEVVIVEGDFVGMAEVRGMVSVGDGVGGMVIVEEEPNEEIKALFRGTRVGGFLCERAALGGGRAGKGLEGGRGREEGEEEDRIGLDGRGMEEGGGRGGRGFRRIEGRSEGGDSSGERGGAVGRGRDLYEDCRGVGGSDGKGLEYIEGREGVFLEREDDRDRGEGRGEADSLDENWRGAEGRGGNGLPLGLEGAVIEGRDISSLGEGGVEERGDNRTGDEEEEEEEDDSGDSRGDEGGEMGDRGRAGKGFLTSPGGGWRWRFALVLFSRRVGGGGRESLGRVACVSEGIGEGSERVAENLVGKR